MQIVRRGRWGTAVKVLVVEVLQLGRAGGMSGVILLENVLLVTAVAVTATATVAEAATEAVAVGVDKDSAWIYSTITVNKLTPFLGLLIDITSLFFFLQRSMMVLEEGAFAGGVWTAFGAELRDGK